MIIKSNPHLNLANLAKWPDPRVNQFFNDALASDTLLVTSVVTEKSNEMFKSLESLVVEGDRDNGHSYLPKHSHNYSCLIYPMLLACKSENLQYVSGDMFKEIPPADAILLKVNRMFIQV